MKIKLAENIKAFRKERKMTQEQLAEALGVTVGAIHKWEKNMSTPELSLIFAMADLFGTSTDVLLGYEWRNSSAGDMLFLIQQLLQEQKFEDAVAEAEKAMKKFPNNFEVVYQSAMAYLEWSRSFDLNNGIQDYFLLRNDLYVFFVSNESNLRMLPFQFPIYKHRHNDLV